MVSVRRKTSPPSAAAAAVESAANSYEEIRRQRVQENLKHLEGLGISKISKSLLEVAKTENKLLKCRPSPRKSIEPSELRRSSRARNHVSSYREDVDLIGFPSHRKRYSRGNDGRSYTGRIASYDQELRAIQRAEKLQSDLDSNHPSFVKAMVRSHVSSCFWLGLPSKFCKEYLPPNELSMVLEDEDGTEYDAIYIGSRTGLSGGWRGFAMDHGLEDGDALVFELVEPSRFKIYIMKACEEPEEERVQDDRESSEGEDLKLSTEPTKSSESTAQKTRITRSSKRAGGSRNS